MIYLMAPYTDKLEGIRRTRFELITLVLGELMQQFPYDWVFSPITQGHVTVPFLPREVGQSHDFWMRQCRFALQEADRVLLLPLPGWRESKGITQELDWCEEWEKPVVLLDCYNFFLHKAPIANAPYAAAWLQCVYSSRLHAELLRTDNPSIVQRYELSLKNLVAHIETTEHE